MRMTFRACIALVAGGLALTACGSDIDSVGADAIGSENASSDEPWEFIDGSGEVVRLDETPTRIIAHAGEAAALMSYGITPVGI
jgi:iron complex transport system substrate-binding protein